MWVNSSHLPVVCVFFISSFHKCFGSVFAEFGQVGVFVIFFGPVVEGFAHGFQDILVCRVRCKVVYFVRVVTQVVEFFWILVSCHEAFLRRGEFVLIFEDFHKCENGIEAFLVVSELGIGFFGMVVSDVFVCFCAYASDSVVDAVAAVSCGDDVCAIVRFIEEAFSVHVFGRLDSRDLHCGRAEVDGTDELVGCSGAVDVRRPFDNKRYVNSSIV